MSVPATTPAVPLKTEAGSPTKKKRPRFADWGPEYSEGQQLKTTFLAWGPLRDLEALPTGLGGCWPTTIANVILCVKLSGPKAQRLATGATEVIEQQNV